MLIKKYFASRFRYLKLLLIKWTFSVVEMAAFSAASADDVNEGDVNWNVSVMLVKKVITALKCTVAIFFTNI